MNLIRQLIIKSSKSNVNFPNINCEKGFIFIHIPKNAGTSVSNALGILKSKHQFAKQYKDLLGWRYSFYFTFCFVRNPWDRFLSLYNYARLDESYYHSAVNPENAMYGKHEDYDRLKNATLNQCAHLLLEGKLTHDKYWNHWQPQSNWIYDDNGKKIVDFIGSVEQIEKEFAFVTKKIKSNVSIHKLNVSSKNLDYRSAFDSETIKIVSKYYAVDIENFKYKF